ncbi:hypothetical protein [Rhizobium sp. WYJ-E13]|uniref:hypothetical protein n=1 Tax=Rhizobium sp. WYJ-E13 TaxID=2849093 RepID=UPI001C1F0204|nr:hypothetical protein [Rhizobium sp. WYJ-E13]QWW70112.1 hypothetical protein KQ933_10635 [Rhizobium sp. WYJ-E13]
MFVSLDITISASARLSIQTRNKVNRIDGISYPAQTVIAPASIESLRRYVVMSAATIHPPPSGKPVAAAENLSKYAKAPSQNRQKYPACVTEMVSVSLERRANYDN